MVSTLGQVGGGWVGEWVAGRNQRREARTKERKGGRKCIDSGRFFSFCLLLEFFVCFFFPSFFWSFFLLALAAAAAAAAGVAEWSYVRARVSPPQTDGVA